MEDIHWADLVASKIIREKGDKGSYTLAAGITPSGTVHIGNFREIITVDLVKRALENKGKKVRFIYSWDDYDVFRKVPKNMPDQELLKRFLRKPITEVPDTYGCHENYAQHNEKEVEISLPDVDIHPEFIHQSRKYRSCDYAEGMKTALEGNSKIKDILNRYRKEPLSEEWLPTSIFCESCSRDTITKQEYPGGYKLYYECGCGDKKEFDLREKGIAKLKWRIDWPMRWDYEKVDFEPGGKDHSTPGGSRDTGKQIAKSIWSFDAPVYQMYDFVILDAGGKISSSEGNVITLKDCLEVYEPEIIRWMFASSRPNREFAVFFNEHIIKVYEDFDKCERRYFSLGEIKDERERIKQKRIYELSSIGDLPEVQPIQPGFRHITTILQINSGNIDKTIKHFESELKNEHDKKKLYRRISCVKNWLEKYAPEEYRFSLTDSPKLPDKELLPLFKELADKLLSKEWTPKDLHSEFYALCSNHNVQIRDFFRNAYSIMIDKEKGPRLANFILEIGREKTAGLLNRV